MSLRVLAVIRNNNVDVGCRLFNMDTKSIRDVNMGDAKSLIDKYGCVNAKIENGEFVGTECNIDRLAELDTGLSVRRQSGLIVTGKIMKGNKVESLVLVNLQGLEFKLSKNKAIGMLRLHGACNVSIVGEGDSAYVKGIKKEIPIISQ